jgi:hypothetical protein
MVNRPGSATGHSGCAEMKRCGSGSSRRCAWSPRMWPNSCVVRATGDGCVGWLWCARTSAGKKAKGFVDGNPLFLFRYHERKPQSRHGRARSQRAMWSGKLCRAGEYHRVIALHMPVDNLVRNWVYMVMAELAWNMKAWFAMMVPFQKRSNELLRMEYRRFLNAIILLPAQIVLQGRKMI